MRPPLNIITFLLAVIIGVAISESLCTLDCGPYGQPSPDCLRCFCHDGMFGDRCTCPGVLLALTTSARPTSYYSGHARSKLLASLALILSTSLYLDQHQVHLVDTIALEDGKLQINVIILDDCPLDRSTSHHANDPYSVSFQRGEGATSGTNPRYGYRNHYFRHQYNHFNGLDESGRGSSHNVENANDDDDSRRHTTQLQPESFAFASSTFRLNERRLYTMSDHLCALLHSPRSLLNTSPFVLREFGMIEKVTGVYDPLCMPETAPGGCPHGAAVACTNPAVSLLVDDHTDGEHPVNQSAGDGDTGGMGVDILLHPIPTPTPDEDSNPIHTDDERPAAVPAASIPTTTALLPLIVLCSGIALLLVAVFAWLYFSIYGLKHPVLCWTRIRGLWRGYKAGFRLPSTQSMGELEQDYKQGSYFNNRNHGANVSSPITHTKAVPPTVPTALAHSPELTMQMNNHSVAGPSAANHGISPSGMLSPLPAAVLLASSYGEEAVLHEAISCFDDHHAIREAMREDNNLSAHEYISHPQPQSNGTHAVNYDLLVTPVAQNTSYDYGYLRHTNPELDNPQPGGGQAVDDNVKWVKQS